MKVVVLVGGLAIAAAIAWYAAEAHYDNCIQTAKIEIESGDPTNAEQVIHAIAGYALAQAREGLFAAAVVMIG